MVVKITLNLIALNMKVLITGINGFVGSNFIKKWKQYELYGLDINTENQAGVVHTYNWDELDGISSIDAIVHLAGKAHDLKNESLAEDYFRVNTELTKQVFDYFLKSSARKFVFFSSVKAARDSTNGEILYEDVEPMPIGPYGESKIEAEKYLLSMLPTAERFNKKVYILRPCMIYGPRNKGNLNLLYKVVTKGIPWPLGAYENRRSFCSIDNVAYVVSELINQSRDVESGVYHVCDDESLSTNELIRLIAESVGKKARIWKMPTSLMSLIAKIGGVLHLPLNKDRLFKLTEDYVVSNNKIKNALDIKMMPVKAERALLDTFDSFKKEVL